MLIIHPDTMMTIVHQHQRELIDEASERRRVHRGRNRRRS